MGQPLITVIRVRPNGSLKVTGPARIVLLDGTTVEIPEGVTEGLCRCGQSANRPYCDGTHRRVGWVDPRPAVDANEGEENPSGARAVTTP